MSSPPDFQETQNPKLRLCGRCGEHLPREFFARNNSEKCGLQSWCRKCMTTYSRERYKHLSSSPVVVSSKMCFMCKRDLPAELFQRAIRGKHGLYSYCRECSAARLREYRKNNPNYGQWEREYRKKHENSDHYRRVYGISLEEYKELCKSGTCSLCGATSPGTNGHWPVDHCHATGRVRGVLCMRCNTGIGFYETWQQEIGEEQILSYLGRHESNQLPSDT
jgi:hypothetical protein